MPQRQGSIDRQHGAQAGLDIDEIRPFCTQPAPCRHAEGRRSGAPCLGGITDTAGGPLFAPRATGAMVAHPPGAPMIRRTFASGLLCSACAALACAASAQDGFLDRPIRIIVPFAVGENTNGLARLFSQNLGARLKTSITGENKIGPGSVLGPDAGAKAPAD